MTIKPDIDNQDKLSGDSFYNNTNKQNININPGPTVIPLNNDLKPKLTKDYDTRYEVLTSRTSYWINVARAIMMVNVMCSHWHNPWSQDFETNKLDFFLPHVLANHGYGVVHSFFLLSGFFGMVTVDKIQRQHLTDTKQFLKQFALQQIKRYFHLRAVIFMWGLGVGAFYCWVLGERGDIRHYLGPRKLSYWIDFYAPVYIPGRTWRHNGEVNGASWYNLCLTNIEFFFYTFLLVTYFIRKKQSEKAYGFTFTIGMLILLAILEVTINDGMNYEGYFYYLGALAYWLRVAITKTGRGHRIIDFLYSIQKNTKIIVWGLSLSCAYLWIVTNRIDIENSKIYMVHAIFLFTAIVFDLFPYGKLPGVLDKFVQHLKRVQMEIYMIHQSFIYPTPHKYYPEIIPRDISIICPTYVHFFISWLVAIQFIVFSYPVHFVSKPLRELPQWVYDRITKKDKEPNFYQKYWISVVGLGIGTILIILNQANAYDYSGS